MKNKFTFSAFFFLLLFFLFSTTPIISQDTVQYKVAGRTNSPEQMKKPYVILISADGFRFDLAKKYNAQNLMQMSNLGVEAFSMRAAFPTLTFPNHYSIITGMYPSHHGLVDNRFYDPLKKKFYSIGNKKEVRDGSWYGGKPLWVLAEQQKMLSASFFWVGSESDILKVRPTYYYNYSEAFSLDQRMNVLWDWLHLPEEKRPHFITFYFPEVDHAEHEFGVDSKETEAAVKFVDEAVGRMNFVAAKAQLPVNFIFVSDHGFTNVDTVNTLSIPDSSLDASKFIISGGSSMVHLYAKDKKDIEPTYKALKKSQYNYKTYLPSTTPERWHYGKADDSLNRIGDIILVADIPYIFSRGGGRQSAAAHGYDNWLPEMHATFYAWGPAFKENYKINTFQNVHVYPLIAHILGLKFDHKIDGDLEVLKDILKPVPVP